MINKESKYFAYGLLFLILLYIPYVIFGENTFIGMPFDYLNTNVVWMKVLADNNAAFLDNCASLPNIMHQQRISYGSEIDFIFLLFNIFEPFGVLVINSFLICATGYIAFYRFTKYFFSDYPGFLLAPISVCFALLPFWQFGGISISGFPLFFLIFYKIWKHEKLKYDDYLFLLWYLFYSNLIVFTLFIYIFIFIFFLIKQIQHKRINYKLLLVLILSGLVSLGREYRQVLFTLKACFESNRDLKTFTLENLKFTFKDVFNQIIWSNQHANPINITIIIFIIITFPFIYKRIKENKMVMFFLLYIIISELFSMGIGRLIFTQIFELINLQSLSGFSFHRFNIVNQFLWYSVFSIFIYEIYRSKFTYKNALAIIFITLTALNIFRESIPMKNIRALVDKDRFRFDIKFSDYFMLNEYKAINKILPKNKKNYSLLHYGFDPATSNYHNYITYDGIFPFYSKDYDITFHAMIAPLLKIDPERYKYAPLNNYIVPENYKNTHNFLQGYSKSPMNLPISFKTVRMVNVQYILSTVPFTNKELQLQSKIKSDFWEYIYIYKVL